MNNSSIAVLVSGGLDSDVLLADLTVQYRRVTPIYIRQGLVWENVEQYWLRKFIKRVTTSPHPRFARPLPAGEGWGEAKIRPLITFSLPMADLYGIHWSTGKKPVPGARTRDAAVYLPGRNMILSLKAAVFATENHIPVLALGSLQHNPFPDAAPRFYSQWGAALSRGLASPLKIIAPYRRLTKVQVIQKGKHLPLHLSFSCIAPRGLLHCGRCNKCAERRRAFKAAGFADKTRYAEN